MNRVDFDTLPAGFPLESDATLGFMQGNLMDAIEAVAKMMAEGVSVIISGCVVTGSTMTDGWILHSGELLFFEGGTVQSSFIIQESVVQKANQDGTLVDRYISRKAVFGSGSGSVSFSSLGRWGGIATAAQNVAAVGTAGNFDVSDWVIISGMGTLSGGAGGIDSGRAMYGGRVLLVSSYGSAVSDVSPVYLGTDGLWYTSDPGGGLLFNPYSTKHLRTLYRKKLHPLGSVLWWKSAVAELTTFFPGTGLGIGEWDGFAIANGNNGTLNLSSAISGLTAIQRI